jgi:hypothetical protein
VRGFGHGIARVTILICSQNITSRSRQSRQLPIATIWLHTVVGTTACNRNYRLLHTVVEGSLSVQNLVQTTADHLASRQTLAFRRGHGNRTHTVARCFQKFHFRWITEIPSSSVEKQVSRKNLTQAMKKNFHRSFALQNCANRDGAASDSINLDFCGSSRLGFEAHPLKDVLGMTQVIVQNPKCLRIKTGCQNTSK